MSDSITKEYPPTAAHIKKSKIELKPKAELTTALLFCVCAKHAAHRQAYLYSLLDKKQRKEYTGHRGLQARKSVFDDDAVADSAVDYLYSKDNQNKTQSFLKNSGFPTLQDRAFNKQLYGATEEQRQLRDLLKSKTNSILSAKLPTETDRAFLHGLMGEKAGEDDYQKQLSDTTRALSDLQDAFRGTPFEREVKPIIPIDDVLTQVKHIKEVKPETNSKWEHSSILDFERRHNKPKSPDGKEISANPKNDTYSSSNTAKLIKTSGSGPDGTWEKRGLFPWQRTYKVEPPKWEPQHWNDSYYTDDNMTYVEGKIESTTNCYAYALNITSNPKTGKPFGFGGTSDFGLPVGKLSAGALENPQINPENTVAMVQYDIEELGWTMEKATLDTPVPKGKWKIAIAIDPGHQYHFYRQDADGAWSHKPGHGVATQYDSSGKKITNPQTADGNYGGANYNVFCGYFIIGPK